MLTRNIIKLLEASSDLSSSQISETLDKKKTIVTCTLNYLFRRNILIRNLTENPSRTRGRKNVYTYRVNDAAIKNEAGMVVGEIRTVPDEERSIAGV